MAAARCVFAHAEDRHGTLSEANTLAEFEQLESCAEKPARMKWIFGDAKLKC